MLLSVMRLAGHWRAARPLPHIPTTPHEWSKRKRLFWQIIGGIFLGAAIITPFALMLLMRYGR